MRGTTQIWSQPTSTDRAVAPGALVGTVLLVAQKYVVQVIDDLDGTELDAGDVEEVRFGLDGTAYVIDLSRDNAGTLRSTLTRYTDAARRDQVATRPTTTNPRTTGSGRKDLDQVRQWANANGYTVSSRGRIPSAVLEAYDAQ